jgi:hypothetical protein
VDTGSREENSVHLEHLDNFPSQVRQLFGAAVRSLPGGITLPS